MVRGFSKDDKDMHELFNVHDGVGRRLCMCESERDTHTNRGKEKDRDSDRDGEINKLTK